MITSYRQHHPPFVLSCVVMMAIAISGCEKGSATNTDSNDRKDGAQNSSTRSDPAELNEKIRELTQVINKGPENPDAHFERADAHYKLSNVGPVASKFQHQALALADLNRAHELAGGDCLVNAKTGGPLSLDELNKKRIDAEGQLLEFPNVRRVSDGHYVRVGPGNQEVRIGGPGMAKALVKACVLLMNQYNMREAQSYAERANACDPDNFKVRVLQPYVHGSTTGDWHAAQGEISQLAQSDEGEESVFAWVALARANMGINRPVEAESAYRKVLEMDPNSRVARNNLGLLLNAMGRADEAQALLQESLKVNKSDLFTTNSLGISLTDQGKYDEAIAVLKELVEVAPGFPAAWSNLGNAYAGAEEPELAIDAYRHAIELVPNDFGTHLNMADVYCHTNRFGKAEEIYLSVISWAPNYATAYYSAGVNYLEMKAYKKAEAKFKEYTQMEPSDARGWRNLGFALQQQKKNEEAERAYTSALEIEPQHGFSLNMLGVLNQRQGKYDTAMQYYVKACNADPKWQVPLWNVNRVALQADQVDKLVEYMKQLIEDDIMKPTAMLILAQAQMIQGEIEAAVRVSQSGLALDQPGSRVYFYHTWGFCQMLEGEYAAAVQNFEKAAKEENASTYVSLWLHIALMGDGKSEAAKMTIEMAKSNVEPEAFLLDLLRFFNGEMDEEALLAEAANGTERCEAFYYIGEEYAINGLNAEAARSFQQSVDTNLADNIEYLLARCRLDAMGKKTN